MENNPLTKYLFTPFRNCYCTHLMQYVLAKMIFATNRMQQCPGFDPFKFPMVKDSFLRYEKERIKDPDPSRKNDNNLYDFRGN